MPIESSVADHNPEPKQTDNLGNTPKEDLDKTIEMAAELFAELFWKHWLYIKEQRKTNQGELPSQNAKLTCPEDF